MNSSTKNKTGNVESNISQFPDRKIVDQEAAEWLIKLDSDKPLSHQEQTALRDWLARGPVHREALNQLNSFWGNNVLTELIVPPVTSGAKSEAKPEDRPEERQSLIATLAQWLKESLWSPGGVTVTASIALIALTLTLVIGGNITDTNGIYATIVGQQKTIEMADGSRLQLNTNSKVAVEYSDNFRNIRLIQGEVHFDVAKNPQLPFRVYAGNGRVQAVGTAFTVYLKDKEVDILVTEGRVALASLGSTLANVKDNKITTNIETKTVPEAIDHFANSTPLKMAELDAGQAAILKATENQPATQTSVANTKENTVEITQTMTDEELARRQSWRSGLLVFSGEPLTQVIDEISRYTTISIEIADPSIGAIEIGGRYRVGDIDEMFDALEANFGLQVKRLAYNRVQLVAAH